MRVTPRHLFVQFIFCFALSCVVTSNKVHVSRSQFPNKFLFGAASSAYQIEGAVSEDGRGLSTWDVFAHTKGKIIDGLNADVAIDHYHRYQEDIELMHSLGINSYRFSISWTRILPRGRYGDVNPKGVEFYNKLINNLLRKGIEPFVTLHHFETPQELEDRYKSWLSPLIQDDFAHFAEVCFEKFGDRVKYWSTFNEPNLFATLGYLIGLLAPGRCSAPFGNCSAGNSEVEPVIAMHNMILSHARATEIYRKHYQPKQRGQIGVVLNCVLYEPFSDKEADREAANRAMVFNNAWFLDPLIHGDYPSEVKHYLGDRLPQFSKEESNRLKVGLDFIGVNHYIALYAKDCIQSSCNGGGGSALQGYVFTTGERNGVPIGERTAVPSFFVVPDALEKTLGYFKTRYNNKPMFVTENGIAQKNKLLKPGSDLLNDFKRVEYHNLYLASLARAITNGADVRGYFVWSLMDSFEWASGFTLRFSLYYVDYHTQKRTPKLSAKWYKNFLANSTHVGQG